MYPFSDRFLPTLAESHAPVTEVTLFRTDGQVEHLEHVGGSVTVDRGSQTRRTCTVTVADLSLIPRTPADKVATYGAQLRLARGVRYSDGAQELVPLGVFRVDEVGGDVDEGPVTISGKSLEAVIADDKFVAPHRATGNAVNSITALIQRSIPDAQIVSTVAGATIGARTWDVEGDPWAAILELGAAIGAEVYCDAGGTFVIAELPDLLTATPVWEVAAGEGGVYVSATRSMSVDGVYNGVLARGESTETGAGPFSDLVVDNDPGSETYWGGPFGRRPMFYSSSTLTTTGQCTAAATLLLRSAKAPNASADISTLPNPALEPGDVIRVVYPDGTRELHQVASFSVPLEVGGDFSVQTISAKEGS
ncbi:DUF5047 domain-containing protein [Streptomyces sp. PKU-EA00015]|uniref:DUF5047 domain-containing protein n=1 Tax=Streptomyces sp. PKU-EA00015 TaxID=2748326 RepID=UPI00159FBCE6|nr:DUF5047 domain-containing protein [Streptomyces sp. PKU-EA00015]NWF25228.1 DUF5047 domain-containing protein [Streptomyces sp. PKU-EA00015]